jgi:hypothetical protein
MRKRKRKRKCEHRMVTNLVSDQIAEHVIDAIITERAEFRDACVSFENVGPVV